MESDHDAITPAKNGGDGQRAGTAAAKPATATTVLSFEDRLGLLVEQEAVIARQHKAGKAA